MTETPLRGCLSWGVNVGNMAGADTFIKSQRRFGYSGRQKRERGVKNSKIQGVRGGVLNISIIIIILRIIPISWFKINYNF